MKLTAEEQELITVLERDRRALTARDRYMEEISRNPRFKEAKKSGQGFGIVGSKLTRQEINLALDQARAIGQL